MMGAAAASLNNNSRVGGSNVSMASRQRRPGEESKDTESVASMRSGLSQATAVTYATDMLGITADT